MKNKLYLSLTAAFALFSLSIKAQGTAVPKDVKTTYYYSFENVSSDSQIEHLKNSVSMLKGVAEVKSAYKPEKGMGQITVVVIEKAPAHESDVLFDIRSLKNAIIQNQLTPLELTQEESPIEN